MSQHVDVVVVGAGITGLTSARRLSEAGYDVAVVEAKDRVGGRLDKAELGVDGKYTDTGGQFAGPGQGELLELARELGVETFKVHDEGEAIWYFDGERKPFDGIEPPLPPNALAEFRNAVDEVERLRKEILPEAPWSGANSLLFDGVTWESWLRENVQDPAARHAFEIWNTLVLGVQPARVSLLQVLWYYSAVGGWEEHLQGETYRFVGGAAELPLRMATELGERVHLGCPVRVIDQSDAKEVVVKAEDLELRARRCIVAMSPSDARYIEFRPKLPARREHLHRQFMPVSLIKSQAVYEEPFWREEGLSGICLSDLDAASFSWDNSPPDGAPGVLLTFVYHLPEFAPMGITPRIEDDPEERKAAVLSAFAEYFGPKALDPIGWVEKNWIEEPYTYGCTGVYPPGMLTTAGPVLKDAIDRIHWGSAENGTSWGGGAWMNGGVDRAEELAREVAAAMDAS